MEWEALWLGFGICTLIKYPREFRCTRKFQHSCWRSCTKNLVYFYLWFYFIFAKRRVRERRWNAWQFSAIQSSTWHTETLLQYWVCVLYRATPEVFISTPDIIFGSAEENVRCQDETQVIELSFRHPLYFPSASQKQVYWQSPELSWRVCRFLSFSSF